jgi:hypothetical protein
MERSVMKRMLMIQALPAALLATAFAVSSLAASGEDTTARRDAQLESGKIVTVDVAAVRPEMRQQEYQLSDRLSAADQLMTVGPPTSAMSRFADRTNCVKDATQGAMTQARELISMAERAKRHE